MSQDLGSGSRSCQLDATGVVAACEDLRQQIIAGCDLVVISKFGKLEAGRGGLTSAFAAAAEADIPILTAVSPAFNKEWLAFVGSLATFLPAEADALDDWWQAVSSK
ncbi:DUF2478 domain-containing protein [Beijerinckia sp. L45]|uniref:DUF2478 domain-containing protein n=1 Tax=Beijerinckia sp. L45 TaxID=1641855 RepID=UPI00131DB46A